jgi:hypothetical protein
MMPTKLDKLYQKAIASTKSEAPQEHMCGFSIHTGDEGVIKDNANERFSKKYGDAEDRAEAIGAGLVSEDKGHVTITENGWETLNKDVRQLEINSLAWLKKTFNHAVDDGHDSVDDLVGRMWFDKKNREQIEQLHIGLSERIDMSDASYGSLAGSAWKNVSSFGQSLLGGQISFTILDREIDKDQVEEIYDAFQTKRKKR